MRKFRSLLILSALLISISIPIFAANNIENSGSTGNVPVEVTQQQTIFDVSVPTTLPVDVSASGSITVSSNNKIINNSYGPIEIKEIQVTPQMVGV